MTIRPEYEISLEGDMSREDILAIHHAMTTSYETEIGSSAYEPLNVALRDAHGALIGGLSGSTFWHWFSIDLLWVDERYRRRGMGRELVATAEREARRRGCTAVHLDTFSSSAAAFYERLGYSRVAVLQLPAVGAPRYSFARDLLSAGC